MVAEQAQTRTTPRTILLMLGAMALLSAMDALLKFQSDRFALPQILFFRYAFGLFPVLVLAFARRDWQRLRPKLLWVHVARAFCGITALGCFVFAIRKLSLAGAVTIFFSAPLLMSVLSLILLGHRPTRRILAAVGLGLAGVLVAMRPGEGVVSLLSLLVLGAAAAYALAQVLAHKYAKTESAESLTLSLNLIAGAICATLLPFFWTAPLSGDWLRFVLLGLLGGGGLYLLTEAMRLGTPNRLAVYEYTAVAWAVLFDAIIWGVLPDTLTLVGCALIASSGLLVVNDGE